MSRSSSSLEGLRLQVEPSRVGPADSTLIFFSSFWFQGTETIQTARGIGVIVLPGVPIGWRYVQEEQIFFCLTKSGVCNIA